MNIFKKNKKILFPVILAVIAVGLRLYRLPEWYFFNIDEDWYSYILHKIIIFKKPVLIGWEMPGGILLPPVMYYFGSLVRFLSGNNPLGNAYAASFFSVIAVILIYFVGKKIFQSEKLAIIASIIFCLSYFVNIYSRLTITLFLSPLLSLLTYYSLYQISRKKINWLYFLAIVLMFATQEGSTWSLIALSVIFIFLNKQKFKFKDLVLPFLVFLIIFLPVVIFDIRHDFLSARRVIAFFNIRREETKTAKFNPLLGMKTFLNTPARVLLISGTNDINIQILPCSQYRQDVSSATSIVYTIIGLISIVLFIIIFSIKKTVVFGNRIIFYHIVVVLIGLSLFSVFMPGHLHEWFFIVLVPAFVYIIAGFLNIIFSFTGGKIITFIFLGVFIINNLYNTFKGTAVVGYRDKYDSVKYIKDYVKNSKFNLGLVGNGCNGYGYRYLFTYLNKEPVKSYMDSQFANWLYPAGSGKGDFDVYIAPLPDIDSDQLKKEYQEVKSKQIAGKQINNIEIIITRSKP